MSIIINEQLSSPKLHREILEQTFEIIEFHLVTHGAEFVEINEEGSKIIITPKSSPSNDIEIPTSFIENSICEDSLIENDDIVEDTDEILEAYEQIKLEEQNEEQFDLLEEDSKRSYTEFEFEASDYESKNPNDLYEAIEPSLDNTIDTVEKLDVINYQIVTKSARTENSELECTFCAINFMNSKSRIETHKNHMNMHLCFKYLIENNNQKFEECQKCNKLLCEQSEQDSHICDLEQFDDNEKLCGYCGNVYESRDVLKEHLMFKHLTNFECPDSNCGITNKTFRFYYFHLIKSHHALVGFINDFTCEYCSANYSNYMDLNRHKRKDCEGKSFVCNVHCDRKFGTEVLLKAHLRAIKMKFVCEICDKKFQTSSFLKIHNASLHSQLRPFKCPQCGMTFKLKTGLAGHLHTHGKERIFKCTIEGCLYAATNAKSLKTHYRVHEGPSNCPIQECSKQFSCPNNVTSHLKSVHGYTLQETKDAIRNGGAVCMEV
ncbi:unnamed protein product [Diamesa hyperborea]